MDAVRVPERGPPAVRRGANYVGEEDWAATSTGVLGALTISHKAVGVDDVTILLDTGGLLNVSKVDGPSGGVLCADSDEDKVYGPFNCIECLPGNMSLEPPRRKCISGS